MSLPTPLYDLSEHPDVYEPREDTHLFLDALEKEANFIRQKQPLLACEVGSGSGILITALATILKSSCAYFSTDVNVSACAATKKTSLMNGASVEVIAMNLTGMFTSQFDLILFNPPYVLTEDREITGRGLNRAYAGGSHGREIIDVFLSSLPNVLSKEGVCYLLVLRENKIEEIKRILGEFGFKNEVVIERKVPGEYLYVYKFFR